LADIAMGVLGGSLKLKEKITGRFADILSYMYIATSVLKRFEAEGRKEEDLPFVHYNLKLALSEIQKAFDGIFDNLKIPGFRWFFKGWFGAWSRINSIGSLASDGWSHAISSAMLGNVSQRQRHTLGIHIPQDRNQQLGRLEYAFELVLKTNEIEKKIRTAVKDKILPKRKLAQLFDEAVQKKVITLQELAELKEAEVVRLDAIMVDDFSPEEYFSK
ncbi:MAG TPA: DUF1974 domain-containing protein, partial [Pseudobdellovibrionaceae bacterium]|nr:DUF1974 domain-containing protein [Pseudobdellovibrionaceae bacterium]